MKKIKKLLWRFFPLVVCCCIIFSFATYASAASNYTVIDYRDYAYSLSQDNGKTNYHVRFPVSMNFWQWHKNLGSKYDVLSYGDGDSTISLNLSSVDWSKYSNTNSDFVYRPLGYSVLDLDYIPNGTIIHSIIDVNVYNLNVSGVLSYRFLYQYYDSDMNVITNHDVQFDQIVNTGEYGDTCQFYSFDPIEKPANAAYVMFRCVISFYLSGADPDYKITIKPEPLELDIGVDDLYILQAETGKTNKLLSELEKQNDIIIDQNENLINGTPEQNNQVGAAVNGLENSAGKMEDLADDMKVDKPDLSGVDVSPDAIVSVADRALLTAPLTKLWEDPTILGMVTTVFILVLVSWVFFGKKG